MFILNDLGKLLVLCYEETKDLLKERRQIKDNKENEIDQVKIELEQEEDGEYLQNLEEKLDKVHLQLIKACAARNPRINENDIKNKTHPLDSLLKKLNLKEPIPKQYTADEKDFCRSSVDDRNVWSCFGSKPCHYVYHFQ
jgi:hypothetical protein